ncbi:GNAT family N-acetyltransferase [Ruegeria pomeroyi]|nr:GNAT family N-acetyltransferase [Ruegeria pomeroyi]
MSIPTLHTDRLTLRAPQLADFEHWAAFFASERSVHERGMMERAAAWRVWASDVGIWTLRGYGPFGVELRDSGAYVGEVGIYEPDGYPGPELGWFVIPDAEGKGYAAEAARAVMIWARRNLGWDHLTNIIDPDNARSIALGLRLGGVIDPDGIGEDPGDVVIAHDLRGLA